MICLCRMRGLTSSSDECAHTRDEDRALSGTWVMDEGRLAVEKGTGSSKYMRCTSFR